MLLMTLAGFACSRANPDPDRVPEPAADLTAKGDTAPGESSRTAVFAGGCFWCTEAVFEQLDGVSAVVSGYAGGTADSANYPAVSGGLTDHAEVIQITYDPARIGYGDLLKVFFTVAHDPTQIDRQGPDHGRQYRSAIFFADEQERSAAEGYIKQLEEAKVFARPIATTLEPLERFYPAEDYHQDFVQQNPTHPYVAINALPKVKKVHEKFGDHVRTADKP